MTFDEIARLAGRYARAREATETLADAIRDEQRKALRGRLRTLQRRVAEQAAAEEALRDAIGARPELFASPRTHVVDGIKFGLRKQPGAVSVGDEARAIGLLRRKLPERADALVNVRETLDRKALRKLDAGALAAIGVTIERATDEVTIAAPAGELDKFIAALVDHYLPAEAA